MNNKQQYEIKLHLNEKGEVIPKYLENCNATDKMKQVQTFYVDGQIKKIAYSEQSIAGSLSAYKNGQKGGDPSIRTIGMYEEIKQALEEGKEVKVIIEKVENSKTPKEKCTEELERYKGENGNYPDWNKQKNHKKWDS